MPDREPLLPKHGGYRKLKSFQIAQLAYDVTVRFCDRYIDRRSRTHDQMTQAARSGVQNIAEGSQASGTSKKMELKLVGVARGSLEELLGDYKDFLRQHGLAEWGKDHPMARLVRRLAYAPDRSYKTYSTYIENAPPELDRPALLIEGDELVALFGGTDQQAKLGRVAFNVQIPLAPAGQN